MSLEAPRRSGGVRRFLIGAVEAYRRYVSPCLGRHCRFHPTCSRYAIEALTRFGILKGSVLAVRRVLRCHPFHPGGLDPVPPADVEGTPTAGDGLVPSRRTLRARVENAPHSRGNRPMLQATGRRRPQGSPARPI